MRTSNRGTWQFPLRNRLLVENVLMKKMRIREEWGNGIVESHWKLATKDFFKFDQNSKVRIRDLRASHLLRNFRTFCRGNSLSDTMSFSYALPSRDECLSKDQMPNLIFVAFEFLQVRSAFLSF